LRKLTKSAKGGQGREEGINLNVNLRLKAGRRDAREKTGRFK